MQGEVSCVLDEYRAICRWARLCQHFGKFVGELGRTVSGRREPLAPGTAGPHIQKMLETTARLLAIEATLLAAAAIGC